MPHRMLIALFLLLLAALALPLTADAVPAAASVVVIPEADYVATGQSVEITNASQFISGLCRLQVDTATGDTVVMSLEVFDPAEGEWNACMTNVGQSSAGVTCVGFGSGWGTPPAAGQIEFCSTLLEGQCLASSRHRIVTEHAVAATALYSVACWYGR